MNEIPNASDGDRNITATDGSRGRTFRKLVVCVGVISLICVAGLAWLTYGRRDPHKVFAPYFVVPAEFEILKEDVIQGRWPWSRSGSVDILVPDGLTNQRFVDRLAHANDIAWKAEALMGSLAGTTPKDYPGPWVYQRSGKQGITLMIGGPVKQFTLMNGRLVRIAHVFLEK